MNRIHIIISLQITVDIRLTSFAQILRASQIAETLDEIAASKNEKNYKGQDDV